MGWNGDGDGVMSSKVGSVSFNFLGVAIVVVSVSLL